MMEYPDSFEVILENDEKTGESLTTTVLDDLTKVYEELDGGVNELQDNQDNTPFAQSLLNSTKSMKGSVMEEVSPPIPPTTTDTDTDDDHPTHINPVLLQSLNHQTSTYALLRDRMTFANAQLSSLISTLPFNKPFATASSNNKSVILALLSTLLLTASLFLIHTYLYSQILTTQNLFHANMTQLERDEVHYQIEQRDQLRDYMMHKSYETARVSEENLRQCGVQLEKMVGDFDHCRKNYKGLESTLKSCEDKMGRFEEYLKVLKDVKKENERLKGILMILVGVGASIGIFIAFFNGSKAF